MCVCDMSWKCWVFESLLFEEEFGRCVDKLSHFSYHVCSVTNY